MSNDSYVEHDIIKYDPTAKAENDSKSSDFELALKKGNYSPWDPFVLGGLVPEEKSIVVREIFLILKKWKNDLPLRKEILNDLLNKILNSYESERSYNNSLLKREVPVRYVELNEKLLRAKTLEDSLSIIKDAEKEHIEFSQPYVNLLSLTIFLKNMEKKGLLEFALEELYLVNAFNKSFVDMMTTRKEKESENLKAKDFILKIEKKTGPFIEYLVQVEDKWHPLSKNGIPVSGRTICEASRTKSLQTEKNKKISKDKALAEVFNSNINNKEFIELFRERLNIDITNHNNIIKAFKLFRRLFNKYTNYYYKIEGATKNGYKKTLHPHSEETKEKIGKEIRKRNEVKKKHKRRRRFQPITEKNGQIELFSRKRSSSSSHS